MTFDENCLDFAVIHDRNEKKTVELNASLSNTDREQWSKMLKVMGKLVPS